MGTIVALNAVMLVMLLAFVAFAVDVGYMCNARSELQRCADASALAGAAALYTPARSLEHEVFKMSPDLSEARREARRYVEFNPSVGRKLTVDENAANDPLGEVVLGRLVTPWNQTEPLDALSDMPNTVLVRVKLTRDHKNGSAALFFAPVLGFQDVEMTAWSAATVWYPALLPFATSEQNWNSLESGGTGDRFAYTPKSVSFGIKAESDGIPEILMFPGNWDGEEMPPGNFGIIEIGGGGTELTTLRRQIDAGPTRAEMDVHGGALTSGETIPGRTGFKSSTKHAFLGGHADSRDFAGIVGQVRTLPIYRSASGNGDNAEFVLAKFVIVRIMALRIDSRWRTDYRDTSGDVITGISAQPVTESSELIQARLTR